MIFAKILYTLLISLLPLGLMAKGDKSPFEFRALCTPSNSIAKEFDIEGTHNVDNDWSLWGHNLWKVIGKDAPEEVYALVNGKRDHTQYCFSSQKLHDIIHEWIIDQWGYKGGRFSIMPGDNKRVCGCPSCRKLGNTITSATPAVTDMLIKLAKEFPRHQFFMASYHTTTNPPTKVLPRNAGVMISTMAIPMRYIFNESGGYRKFDALVKSWKAVTSLLYVWEYNRNFDDYLSPYPCLKIMQQRFKYFEKVGIQGIFINGSGDDYSSFDDVQSYVLAHLMQDTDADVEALVRKFYKKYYPESGEMIADYYLSLEKKVQETNHVIPYYGTIEEEIESYLNPEEFVNFWIALDKKSKTIQGPERQRLNAMLTAFAYTRLMLKPSEDDRYQMKLILKEHKDVLNPVTKKPWLLNYKETGGDIDGLIK